tara:strand:- start:1449 stop:3368 length:1920 start_codon:yes stop_codon:yes gene_type:complete
MENSLQEAIEKLSAIQRDAVTWGSGSLLVLAGPGSGKTQVLTCRIAKILDESRDENFRILALTFTNKAADEMKERVAVLAPGLDARTYVGTFHGFCGQILRQHGIHIGIEPDFRIYSQDEDRLSIFEDAIRRGQADGRPFELSDVKLIGVIDQLKTMLVTPKDAPGALRKFEDGERIALLYGAYEDELKRVGALDFNSLIFETYRLVTEFPTIANRYRRSYRYWLLDEYQDTNDAQYRLLRALAGDSFFNVFSVADDDQIIYQWNGASYRQIQRFRSDFNAEVIQLPTNFRCPPAIVEAANRLVAYNVNRTTSKSPLIAGKAKLRLPAADHIQLRDFSSDDEEAREIALEISRKASGELGEVAVIARTRALLEKMLSALTDCGVPAVLLQRRDDFLSYEFRWMVAVLFQVARPLDRRNAIRLIAAFNRLSEFELMSEPILSEAEASGRSYLESWFAVISSYELPPGANVMLNAISPIFSNPTLAKSVIEEMLALSEAIVMGDDSHSDLEEDIRAWRSLSKDIARHIGKSAPLDQFLQELQLRSKEPAPKNGSVSLMTVHGSKGREFDFVYLIGMAEDIMPSFQSRRKGDDSPEMEEERRNCFVAITRTKECLVLSRGATYRGWTKHPSRFLVEMGLVHG